MVYFQDNTIIDAAVNQVAYNINTGAIKSFGATGPTGPNGAAFNGLIVGSSSGSIGFTALNTDEVDITSTSSLSLLVGADVPSSTGTNISFGIDINSFSLGTQLFTPGTFNFSSSSSTLNTITAQGITTSDYLETKNSLNFPSNNSLTFDNKSLLQTINTLFPYSPVSISSLTINQSNGNVWACETIQGKIFQINNYNQIISTTNLSLPGTLFDLTWTPQSGTVWLINFSNGAGTPSSLYNIDNTGTIVAGYPKTLSSLIGTGNGVSIIHDVYGYLWIIAGGAFNNRLYKLDISNTSSPTLVNSVSLTNGGLYGGGLYMDTDTTNVYLTLDTRISFNLTSPGILAIVNQNTFAISFITLNFSGIQYWPAYGVVYDTSNSLVWIAATVNSTRTYSILGINTSGGGSLVHNISTTHYPVDLTIGGGSLWVGNSDTTITEISLTTFQIVCNATSGLGQAAFILWSNYNNNLSLANTEINTTGSLVTTRSIPVVNNSNSTYVLTSGGNGYINGESNLRYDNSTSTFYLGPSLSPYVDQDGINNMVISAIDAFPELNTAVFSSNGGQAPGIVQHFSRGSITGPIAPVTNDVLGQYFCRAMGTGPGSTPLFMNSCMLNFRADYSGASTGCVGGRIVARTRGNVDNTFAKTYGYSRMDITNQGLIRFYDNSGGSNGTVDNQVAYVFPQSTPLNGQILGATGASGYLNWQGGKTWLTYTPTIASPSGVTISTSGISFAYTIFSGICTGTGQITITSITGGTPGTSDPIEIFSPVGNQTSLAVCGSGMIIKGTSITAQAVNCLLSVYISSGTFRFSCNSASNTDTNTTLNTQYVPTIFGSTTNWNTSYTISFSFSYNIS
jgi:hypothetical protein